MKSLRLFIVCVIVSLLVACQSWQQQSRPAFKEFVQSDQVLPLESITDINGTTIDLTNPNKRKLVILFATWCSDSNRLLKALNKTEILNHKDIEIIAIARQQKQAKVKKWRDKHNITIPLATDPDRSIFKRFASAGIPRIITVGKDNRIIKMNIAEGKEQLSLIEWTQSISSNLAK